MSLDSNFYDLPGDRRPRRIYRAGGSRNAASRGAKKHIVHSSININAPSLAIATRTAKRQFKLHRMTLDFIHEITWQEYGKMLERAGFTVTY